jgi:hypothetical protein
MIYIIFEVSGEIKGVTVNRTSTTQIEVSNSFFEEYPQGCWEVVDEEVTLKADADDIRTAFLASIEETVTTPEPIPLSYIRYISLVKAAGGLSAAVATSIIDGTHASDEVNFLQRLMEKHSGNFVMSDPMVQSGLDVLLSEDVINQAGRDAIEANWPVE